MRPLDRFVKYRTGSSSPRRPRLTSTVSPPDPAWPSVPSPPDNRSFSASRPAPVMPHARCRAGLHNANAALPQDSHIRLGGRVIPHIDVHRGSDNHRSGRSKIKMLRKSLASLRKLGQHIGCCRTTTSGRSPAQSQCARSPTRRWPARLRNSTEQVGNDFFSGERREGKRTNNSCARVITTCTRMPRSCSRRTISAAL